MKASVFIDAFAECLVSVAMARKYPEILTPMREQAILAIATRHGDKHADDTGHMFDKLLHDMQNPGEDR